MSVYHRFYFHQVRSPHWKLVFKQQIHTIPKKSSKRKAKESEPKSDVEFISKIETKYEDTKAIIGVSPEFKWGELYQMIRDQNIPDVGLEEIIIYQNVRKSYNNKDATRSELFPCSEFIGWILP